MKKSSVFLLMIIAMASGSQTQEEMGQLAYFSAAKDSTDYEASVSINKEKLRFIKDSLAFEDNLQSLYNTLSADSIGLSYSVFRFGMMGYYQLKKNGKLNNNKEIVSLIDFTKPSREKRFYTIDIRNKKFLFHTYVSHGRNTGEDMARKFSNLPESFQSSLGFSVTGDAYTGSKGYSLRLYGKEDGYNNNMASRAIVMHNADYVSEYWIKRYGRLGRSQGCPALPKGVSKQVINAIKNKTVLFTYFNDKNYLSNSPYLNLYNLLSFSEEQSL